MPFFFKLGKIMKPYVQSNTDIYKLACNFIKEKREWILGFLENAV